jgi:hypothetical protein
MTVAHQLLTFNVSLAPVPAQRTSLGTIALLAPNISGLTGGSGRYEAFASYQEVVDAGITGATLDAALVAFSQPRKPTLIIVNVDVVGLESYLTAYTDFRTYGVRHFAVAMISRTAADQLALSAYIEAINFRVGLAVQMDEVSTGGWPAAIAAIEDNVHTGVVYCDDDTQYHEIAWLANRLTFDWDNTAPSFTGSLQGIDPTDGVSMSDVTAIKANNINVVVGFGTASTYLGDGVNAEGRPFDEVFAIYWFVDRLESRLQDLRLTKDALGQKIEIGPTGQAILESAIRAQFDLGAAAGHFVDEQIEIVFPSDLTSDIANRTITATVNIQEARGANKFTLNLNFTTEPVV